MVMQLNYKINSKFLFLLHAVRLVYLFTYPFAYIFKRGEKKETKLSINNICPGTDTIYIPTHSLHKIYAGYIVE